MRLLGVESRVHIGFGQLAGLYGLDIEANEAALSADPFVGAPGLSAYDVEYLKTISASPGAPVMMVSPDVLPEDWQRLD